MPEEENLYRYDKHHFKPRRSESALGTLVGFEGPGMSRYAQVHLNIHTNGEEHTLVHMLEAAFLAGKRQRSWEIRTLLGDEETEGEWDVRFRKRG
jgi:hypothetical protein